MFLSPRQLESILRALIKRQILTIMDFAVLQLHRMD
jgi:hypothetical protein